MTDEKRNQGSLAAMTTGKHSNTHLKTMISPESNNTLEAQNVCSFDWTPIDKKTQKKLFGTSC